MLLGSKNNACLDEQTGVACRKNALLMRSRMIQEIRHFFLDQSYLEVETPLLIPAPAPEAHIDSVEAGFLYLQTSPELCMKRLLSAGYSKIFQFCKCFRNGERGNRHMPEFTILEWYQTGIGYESLMEECEALILWASRQLGFGESITYQGIEIDLRSPWERIPVAKAFDRYSSLTMDKALEKQCFDEILVKDIEPQLGLTNPTFLYDYPASQAALARLKPSDHRFAERFEIYIVGLELANAFSELTDATEQRTRFESDQQLRRDLGKKVYPMPERFLQSLKHMPESAGIALGVDRLAMIFNDRVKIDDVVCFAPEEL